MGYFLYFKPILILFNLKTSINYPEIDRMLKEREDFEPLFTQKMTRKHFQLQFTTEKRMKHKIKN